MLISNTMVLLTACLQVTTTATPNANQLATVANTAAQQVDGDSLLVAIDQHLGKAEDQLLTLEMVVEDRGHEPRRIGMQMHVRGNKRRIQFLYPGDMKGMRVLDVSAAQSYVYLPAFKKVRRIASHLKEQSMFGSDYNFRDLSTMQLHLYYQGSITAQTASHYQITLTPKKNVEVEHPKIIIEVNKQSLAVETLRYFDSKGQHIRTETRGQFECIEQVCIARKTKMVDHRKDNHWTEVSLKQLQINTHFSDSIFSLRELQRAD